MHWRLKSLQFKLLALLPGGRSCYVWAQDHLTGTTHATPPRVDQKLEVAYGYWTWLERHKLTALVTSGEMLDYGAGWHPTIPLLWHGLGANKQTLVDITANLSPAQTLQTLRVYQDLIGAPKWKQRVSVRPLPPVAAPSGAAAASVLAPLGIQYHAPYGEFLAKHPNHFDLVICTQVLQHVSAPGLSGIFAELFRCLKPGGYFMSTIHLVGHFRNPAARPGQYEHLEPSPGTWENWINSNFMSFNRLKPPDYRGLFEGAGFKLREFDVERPGPDDLAELQRTRIHASFRHLGPEDLGARHLFVVAQKP